MNKTKLQTMEDHNEISSKRTDLLLEIGEKQTIDTVSPDNRKETIAKEQLDIKAKQAELEKIYSTNEREIKGINLYESGRVEIIDDDAAKVQSQNGQNEYLVNSKNETCQCKDHEFRSKHGIICIHRVAEKLERIKYNLKKQEENLKKENIITTNCDVTFASMCS